MTQEDVKQLSWEHLAGKLGVSRQGLVLWRKLPDAPTDRDLAKWEAFIKERGLGVPGQRVGSTMAELKEEGLRLENEIKKAKLAREHRTVIDKGEVSQLLLHLSTDGRTMLYQFLETELPPKLDGMAAVQMRPILREVADSIADRMADLIGQFEKQ